MDWWISRTCRRDKISGREDLLPKVGGCVEEEPTSAVCGNRGLRLRASASFQCPRTHTHTLGTCTIPLGEAAPGCGAEDFNAHSGTPPDDRGARSRFYSSALAYELISQFKSISSC